VPDQRLITLATWGFLVPAVWGFNARWLPVFLGLSQPRPRFVSLAFGLAWAAILAEFFGRLTWFAALLPFAALSALVELLAVALFAANLALTLLQPPAHLQSALAIS